MSKSSQKKCPVVQLGDWEEVYGVKPVKANLWTEELKQFEQSTTYYQTFGGGPEGGYFVKVKMGEGEDLNCASCEGVWKVSRELYQPWSVKKLDNVTLEFEDADEMQGKVARLRLIYHFSEWPRW